jgi:hypothetical protein
MNEKNTLALVAAAPLLYRHYEDDKYPWPIQYGFECGDGWFDLLMSLSLKIEAELQAALAAGKRRQDLQCADQVKEKFGKLRFYLRSGREVPPPWRVWIDEAARHGWGNAPARGFFADPVPGLCEGREI